MAIENTNIDPGAKQESLSMFSQNAEIQLIYGSDDPNKGMNIPTAKIEKIEVKENFFSKLPQLKLVLVDTGYFFNQVGFQIGNMISVKITPKITDEDMLPVAYIDAQYVIESIEYTLDPDRNTYLYTLNCMYGAEKYMNDICVWPPDDYDIAHIDKQYTSADVLSMILPKCGLKYSMGELTKNPADNMAWLNSSLTYCDFAEKIVNHAWFEDDDMPLLYVDRDGVAHYNSLKQMTKESPVVGKYMQNTYYQKVYETPDETGKKPQKPSDVKVYNDIVFRNVGYIQNQGAYGVKTTIFNPYNVKEMSIDTFPPVEFTNLTSLTMNDSCVRMKEFHDNETRLAPISNKSAGQTENIRYSTSHMHFKQTHEYYDYAPHHHNCIKHSFYQQFVFITMDTVNQPGYSSDPSQRVNLGTKININCSTAGFDTTIQSGDYLIVGITHMFYANGKYTLLLMCVNDGINGVGKLRKESKLNKEG